MKSIVDIFKALVNLLAPQKPAPKEMQEQPLGSFNTFVPLPATSSRKLSDAEPTLQKAFKRIRMLYKELHPGYTLFITQSYRSPKDQKAMYAKGRTKPGKKITYMDGYKKKGKHNHYPSRAIDVAVKEVSTGAVYWDNRLYKPLVKLAKGVSKDLGFKVTSGGSWKKLKDYPHLEV